MEVTILNYMPHLKQNWNNKYIQFYLIVKFRLNAKTYFKLYMKQDDD